MKRVELGIGARAVAVIMRTRRRRCWLLIPAKQVPCSSAARHAQRGGTGARQPGTAPLVSVQPRALSAARTLQVTLLNLLENSLQAISMTGHSSFNLENCG